MIDGLRYVIASCLGLLGLYVIMVHVWIVAQSLMGRKAPSMVPLIGGVSASIALVVLPVDGSSRWWWLPLLMDPGCTGALVLMLWGYYKDYIRERGDPAE